MNERNTDHFALKRFFGINRVHGDLRGGNMKPKISESEEHQLSWGEFFWTLYINVKDELVLLGQVF